MPAQLRPAAPQDHDAILRLMVEVIQASVDAPYQRETIDNVSRNLDLWKADPPNCLQLVAEHQGEIVGVVLVKAFWNLCSLFVATPWQGRGIGRALVLQAVEACRHRSPKQAIVLNAAPSAIGFYNALGFVSRPSAQPLPPGFLPMMLSLGSDEATP